MAKKRVMHWSEILSLGEKIKQCRRLTFIAGPHAETVHKATLSTKQGALGVMGEAEIDNEVAVQAARITRERLRAELLEAGIDIDDL